MEDNCKTPRKQTRRSDYNTPSSRRSVRRSQTPSLKALENYSVISAENSPDNPRRSVRKMSPSKRYNEIQYVGTTIKSRKRCTLNIDESKEETDSKESDNESKFSECIVKKDLELFNEEIDVAGKKIYGFTTPRKRDALMKIVSNTPRTPNTPKIMKTSGIYHETSNSKRVRKLDLQSKTPSHLRNKVKKEISKQIQELSDFSADDSEYSPTEDEGNDSTDDNQEEISSEEEKDDVIDRIEKKTSEKDFYNRRISVPILPKTPSRRKSARILTKEYIPESECYFTTHANKKIITSDHTLDKLKNPRLAADHLFALLSAMAISKTHEKVISNLLEGYKNSFSKWLIILNEGFNIICYGLGSKRRLLQIFHKEMLSSQNVIVINGFFPSLTIKDILDGIIFDILNISNTPGNPHEAVDLIENEFKQFPENHLFLIVHNIDGPMLRNAKAQEILSRLAKIENFHLVASIDHINAPLLWDSVKLSNYNFLWWDTTTMLPYTEETAFENSLLVQNSGELALSSMRNVFLSLTTNSRGIYMLIVNHQLKHSKKANYQGMSFKDLYYACREGFLVSSDLALRAQLTEFLDHKLVRNKRSVDGTEFLQIPINADLLQQFLSEQQESS